MKAKIISGFGLFLMALGPGGCAWIDRDPTWHPPAYWFFTDKTTRLDEMVRTPEKSSKGRVTALWVDRSDPLTVLAGTDGGVFKSTDGGREWFPSNRGLLGNEVLSIAQDPSRPHVLYLGVRKFENGTGGIFRSENSGERWEFIRGGPAAYSIHSIWVDSTGVYAGSYGGGLFYSRDGQKEWVQINDGLDRIAVYSLIRNPHETGRMFAGTERGVFSLNEAERKWTPLPMGPADGPVTGLGVDPIVSGKIYLAVENKGLFTSDDSGMQWRKMNLSGKGNLKSLAVFKPQNKNLGHSQVFVGKGSSIFWSRNGGESWIRLHINVASGSSGDQERGEPSILSLALSPGSVPFLYSGWDQGLGIVGGAMLPDIPRGEPLNRGLINASVMDLLVSKHSPSLLIAATWGSGLLKSRDGGESWESFNRGFPGEAAHSIEEHPVKAHILYAGADRGIFKSVDRGETWTRIQSSIRKPIDIAIDPINPEIIYVSSWGDGFFKSEDGGKTWNSKNNGLEVLRGYSIAVDERVPGTLYFGTDFDLYKSVDGGEHWVPLGVRPVQTVVLDPENPSIIYAGTCKWIYKSVDGGKSWRIKRSGMEYTDVYSIAIDPGNTDILYAGTYEGGMYKTEDAGENWFPISSGLTNTHVYSLALDPNAPRILYAGTFSGTFGSGVYRTSDGGKRWNLTHPGMSQFSVSRWIGGSVPMEMGYESSGVEVQKGEDTGATSRFVEVFDRPRN